MNKFIILLSSLIVLILGLLIISFTSINGLHARIPPSEFFVPPNKDIYECKLQWINENLPPNLMCLYKCRDTHGTFEWYEKSWNNKGCKIKTRVYKTELG